MSSTIDQATFNHIVNLLIPHCIDYDNRKTIVQMSLQGCSVIAQLDFDGTAQNFTVHLVDTLLRFGQFAGEPTITLLLKYIKTQVGVDQHPHIDALIKKIPTVKMEGKLPEVSDKSRTDIFIAYSRKNLEIVRRITTDLLNVGVNVWVDVMALSPETPNWQKSIRDAIRKADIVLYMGSPDAVDSPYVQGELLIAKESNKQIFALWVAGDKWSDCAPIELLQAQYIDLRHDYEAKIAELYKALGVTNKPLPLPQKTEKDKLDTYKPSQKSSKLLFVVALIAIFSGLVITFILLPLLSSQVNANALNTELANTNSALVSTTSAAEIASETTTLESTLTPTQTLEIAFVVATLDAQATDDQATANAESTSIVRATEYAIGTRNIGDQTTTATLWTATPTPDITASIDAYRTQQAETATQSWIESWTDTPIPPSSTPDPLQQALQRASSRMSSNAEWEALYPDGFVQRFNRVEMVLVPAGCFTIGAKPQEDDENDGEWDCFDTPFWIDRTEVTQRDFMLLGGENAGGSCFEGANRPVECINWFEASDFCELRDARLPTEAEWEYAARGPDELNFPWGNDWHQDNVVWNRRESEGTSTVGRIPEGTSWIGAYDMAGNVAEWVSSLYLPYPYDDTHENTTNSSLDFRVLRGSSWYDVSSSSFRSAYRLRYNPGNAVSSLGFRCVVPIED